MVEDSLLLVLLHAHHQSFTLQLLQKALKICVKVLKVCHLAYLMDVLLRHARYFKEKSFPQQGLSPLYLLHWVFFYNFPEFRVGSCYLLHVLLILLLCYPKYHVEALFAVDPIGKENFPKVICTKSCWLIDKVYPPYMNFLQESNEIFLNVVENRTFRLLNFLFDLSLNFFF